MLQRGCAFVCILGLGIAREFPNVSGTDGIINISGSDSAGSELWDGTQDCVFLKRCSGLGTSVRAFGSSPWTFTRAAT